MMTSTTTVTAVGRWPQRRRQRRSHRVIFKLIAVFVFTWKYEINSIAATTAYCHNQVHPSPASHHLHVLSGGGGGGRSRLRIFEKNRPLYIGLPTSTSGVTNTMLKNVDVTSTVNTDDGMMTAKKARWWRRRTGKPKKLKSLLMFALVTASVVLLATPLKASAVTAATNLLSSQSTTFTVADAATGITTTIPLDDMMISGLPQLTNHPALASRATTSAVAASVVRTKVSAPLNASCEIWLGLRLLWASILGAAVGKERSSSSRHRAAGLRTMALVSLGAAAFTVCSMYGFGASVIPTSTTGKATMTGIGRYDPSRMASSVAAGVGFVGAGVITTTSTTSTRNSNSKNKNPPASVRVVHGLTTATAIWLSAAMGVLCGVGMYCTSTITCVLTLCILHFGRQPGDAAAKKKKNHRRRNSSTELRSESLRPQQVVQVINMDKHNNKNDDGSDKNNDIDQQPSTPSFSSSWRSDDSAFSADNRHHQVDESVGDDHRHDKDTQWQPQKQQRRSSSSKYKWDEEGTVEDHLKP